MKILELRADNFARLKTVEIRPDGPLVPITGQNDQGKTTCLNAIWTALKGRAVAPPVPIRNGAETARIRLTLGNDEGVEATVTRSFAYSPKSEEYTTEVKVELADGKPVRVKPQALIDSWLGSVTIDPLQFARAPAKDQFDVLKRLVPGVDFDALAKKRKELFDERTDVNRWLKEQRVLADKVVLPAGKVPDKEPDLAALAKQLNDAHARNSAIEASKWARADARANVDRLMDEAEKLRAQAVTLENRAREVVVGMDAIQALPQPIDTAPISAAMSRVKEDLNAWNRARERRHHEAEVKKAEDTAEYLTEYIEILDKQKTDAIAAAKLPVPGLSLGDDVVLLDGLPFEQAGMAKKIRASIAIAMADKPALRVMLIDEGSELDAKSMGIVREMAETADYQVWVCRVEDDGKTGFVIVDGEVAP